MSSLNIANDNAMTAIEANAVAPAASLSSYGLSVTGQASEMAIPLADSFGAGRFAFQENVTQFDLQGKSSMPGSDELTDAKIAAAEARTETKIERLGGKIDVLATTIVGKIESLKDDVSKLKEDVSKSDQYNHDTRLVLISTFVVGFLALAGLLVALLTYGDARFGQGMSVRDVVQTVIREQQEIQKLETARPPPSLPNVQHR